MASSTVQSFSSHSTTIPNPNSQPNPSTQNPASRKRALDHALSSPYFKMRLLLKDLRPLFLQVIGAPEFQHPEAARGIQEKMKLMVDLSKQMAMEAPSITKCSNGSENPAVEKLSKEDSTALGTCIVGGSAFGWNFVTFISREPEYYGRSKESFRAANPKLEAGEAPKA